MHYVGRISRESAVAFLLVEKEVKGGNSAVPNNDEISPGLRWRLIRAARYPLNPPGIAQFLCQGNWLISEVRVSSLDRNHHAINLVAAAVDAPRLVEHAIFGVDLVDGRAPTIGSAVIGPLFLKG